MREAQAELRAACNDAERKELQLKVCQLELLRGQLMDALNEADLLLV